MNAIIVKGLPRPRSPLRSSSSTSISASLHSLLSSTTALSGSPLPLARQQHILPSITEPTSTNDASITGLISCSSIALFSAFA